MCSCHQQHGIEPPFHGYGRVTRETAVKDFTDMINLSFEIIRPRFGKVFILDICLAIPVTDGIVAAVNIDKPFQEPFAALDADRLLSRFSDHILGNVTDKSGFCFDIEQTELIIFNLTIVDHIHCCRDFGNSAEAGEVCKVLPDIHGVGMFAAGATASFIVTEVGVLGSFEPGMSTKNSPPVFSEPGTDGDRFADNPLF